MLQMKQFTVIKIECEAISPTKNQTKYYLLNCTQVAAAATAPTTTTAAAASAAEPGRGAGGERRRRRRGKRGGAEEGAVQAPRRLSLPRPRPLQAVRGVNGVD